MKNNLYASSWNDIPDPEKTKFLMEEITTLAMDLGKKVDDAELTYIVKRLKDIFRYRYSGWRIIDIRGAIEAGKVAATNGVLSVAVIERWMKAAEDNVMKAIIRDRINECQRAKEDSKAMFNPESSERAAAVLWRLGKATHVPAGWGKEEYLERLYSIPQAAIAEGLKDGSVNVLYLKAMER